VSSPGSGGGLRRPPSRWARPCQHHERNTPMQRL
jgi:hypothetical protein